MKIIREYGKVDSSLRKRVLFGKDKSNMSTLSDGDEINFTALVFTTSVRRDTGEEIRVVFVATKDGTILQSNSSCLVERIEEIVTYCEENDEKFDMLILKKRSSRAGRTYLDCEF